MIDSRKARRAGRPRGTISGRGANRWLVRVTLGVDGAGKQIRKNVTVAGSKQDAQRKLTELLRATDAGIPVNRARSVRLAAWLEEWKRELLGGVRERTRDDYASALRYLPPELAGKTLDKIAKADVQQALNRIAAEKGVRTGNSFADVLRIALEAACDNGLVGVNAASKLKRPIGSVREMRTLTRDEAVRLLAVASTFSPMCEAAVRVLLIQGLRPCELLGLKWEDLVAGTLRVRRSLVNIRTKGPKLHPTKTLASTRTLDLTADPRILELFKWIALEQDKNRIAWGAAYSEQNFIFASRIGTPLDRWRLRRRFISPAMKKAGITGARMYDLRHSCATFALEFGGNPRAVADRLGHSDPAFTMRQYVHALQGSQATVTKAMVAGLVDVPA